MKKPALIITSLFFAIIVLSIVRITVSNKISTSGIAVSDMQEKLSSFEKENLALQEQLLDVSSYTQIASKAAELGFVSGKTNLVIGTSVPIALKQ